MSNTFDLESISTSGAPTITFNFHGDTFGSGIAGAKLYGEADGSGGARVRLTDDGGELLADVTIHDRSHRTLTDNVVDICSALMWSHWRWTQSRPVEP